MAIGVTLDQQYKKQVDYIGFPEPGLKHSPNSPYRMRLRDIESVPAESLAANSPYGVFTVGWHLPLATPTTPWTGGIYGRLRTGF